MRPTVGVELRKDVVEEQERGAPVERGDEIELGQFECQDRGSLLTARRETPEVAAVELEYEVVSMRSDQRRTVPDLLLGGLRKTTRQSVPGRFPGEWRCVGLVAERQPCSGRLVRGDLGVGRGERAGQDPEQASSLGDDRRPGVEEGAVPEAELVARGAVFPDRPQQTVALLERPRIRCERIRIRRRTRRRELVDDSAPQGRRTRDEEHLLRGEQHDAEQSCEAGRPPPEPIDPDPLPAGCPGRTGSDDRDLERLPTDEALDPGQIRPPSDQLAIGSRSMRPAPGEEHHRLQQARLARRIRTPDDVRARAERRIEGRVAPEVEQADGLEQGSSDPGRAGSASG